MSSKAQERTKERVAESLELMDDTIRRQDKVVTQIMATAQDAMKVASHSHDVANIASAKVGDTDQRLRRLEEMTLMQRLNWFFRGQLP